MKRKHFLILISKLYIALLEMRWIKIIQYEKDLSEQIKISDS